MVGGIRGCETDTEGQTIHPKHAAILNKAGPWEKKPLHQSLTLLDFLFSDIYYFYFGGHAICSILVPQPKHEPEFPAVEIRSLSQGTTREVPCLEFYQSLTDLGGEGNGPPLQYSCLENPMDGGAW